MMIRGFGVRGVHFKAFLPQSFLYENLFHMRITDDTLSGQGDYP